MANKSNRLALLQSSNPGVKIEMEEVFFAGDNVPLVPISYILKTLGVVRTTIITWEEKGLECSPFSRPRVKLFDLEKLKRWHKDNIQQVYSEKRMKSPINEPYEEKYPSYSSIENVDLSTVSIEEADRLKKINEVRLSEIKISKEMETLIAADDTDRAMAELAITLKSALVSYEKVLPIILKNKSSTEIKKEVRSQNDKMMNDLTAIFKKEFKGDDSLYDIINAIGKSEKTPKEILEFING